MTERSATVGSRLQPTVRKIRVMSKKSPSDKNGIHSDARAAGHHDTSVLHATREQQIARLAYEKAEARGFLPGHEMDDWLEAESEIDGNHAPHLHVARPATARATSHRQ